MSFPQNKASGGVPERRVRAAAARCRDDPSSAYYRDHHQERRTRLRPVTPIAGPPAASSPQTFRGNQLDKQARSGFTASHNDSVETRVYSQHRGGLHVFSGAIHSHEERL